MVTGPGPACELLGCPGKMAPDALLPPPAFLRLRLGLGSRQRPCRLAPCDSEPCAGRFLLAAPRHVGDGAGAIVRARALPSGRSRAPVFRDRAGAGRQAAAPDRLPRAAGHCARAGREIPCAPRPRLPVRFCACSSATRSSARPDLVGGGPADHVGEHVENLAQRSDRAIKQATAATDALLGNAGHVAKGATRRGTPGCELARISHRRGLVWVA